MVGSEFGSRLPWTQPAVCPDWSSRHEGVGIEVLAQFGPLYTNLSIYWLLLAI